MVRDERRRWSRMRCYGAMVYVSAGRRAIPSLLVNLSARGMRLAGVELPAPGTWSSLSIVAPPRELAVVGHVAWNDRRSGAIGVELEAGSPRHQHDIAEAMRALTVEAATNPRAAALLVDDPGMAAQLCEPLRRHGFLPCSITTPRQAARCLIRHRPHADLAIISSHARGWSSASEAVAFLVAKHPDVARILIGDPTPGTARVDEVLSSARGPGELDELLDGLALYPAPFATGPERSPLHVH